MALTSDGHKVPALERRPVLLTGLDFYFTAYRELMYDRPVGMTLGPIPWSSVVKWGELHGLDVEEIAVLDHHIRAMEKALSEFREKREQDKGGSK